MLIDGGIFFVKIFLFENHLFKQHLELNPSTAQLVSWLLKPLVFLFRPRNGGSTHAATAKEAALAEA